MVVAGDVAVVRETFSDVLPDFLGHFGVLDLLFQLFLLERHDAAMFGS